jgi:hypothetical protein
MDNFFSFLFTIAVYVYISYSLMVIVQKCGIADAWLAWIPIANAYVMCKAGGKPGWWVLLLFIPFVNIFIAAIVWIEITKKLGKSPWLLLLFLIPLLNLALVGYLAFS